MKHNKIAIQFFFIGLIFSLFFTSCQKDESTGVQPASQSRLLLGTSCKITIYDHPDKEIFEKAFARIEDIENKMSVNIETSEVSSVNMSAGIAPVEVSEDTFAVISKALTVSELSGGAFDITVEPLVDAWGIGSDDARVPSQQEIDSLLPLIDYKDIVINEDTHTVFLPVEGMGIDLGGIAKGYAADEVAEILKEEGVEKAIINLGGNVLTIGSRVDGTPWRIGVQNPDAERGGHVMILKLEDQALVTSGPYERYLEVDGETYHHILDTTTGYPVQTNLTSASIITRESFIADALSTAIYSEGIVKGLELIDSLDSVDAIFIDDQKNIYLSESFANQQIEYSISNDEFTVKVP